MKAFVLCFLNVPEFSSLRCRKSQTLWRLSYYTHLWEVWTWTHLLFPGSSESPWEMPRCSHSNHIVVGHSSDLSGSYFGTPLLAALSTLCSVVQTITGVVPFWQTTRAATTLEQLKDFTKVLSINGGNYITYNLYMDMLLLERDYSSKILIADPLWCNFLFSCMWSWCFQGQPGYWISGGGQLC